MRKVCADFDLAGINKDPLNKGILTGKFNSTSTFPENDIRSRENFSNPEIVKRLKIVDEIRDILTSNGRTMAQGALAYIWGLDERMVPIPGFKSVKQVTGKRGRDAVWSVDGGAGERDSNDCRKYELKG